MKRILRETFVLAALMILSVFTISILWVGLTDEIRLVLELFVLSFIISVANYFVDEYTTLSLLGTYIAKYFVAVAVLIPFGFIVGWFYAQNFWMAFIYVGVVLVLAYFVDAFQTKKDIEYINSRVKEKNYIYNDKL